MYLSLEIKKKNFKSVANSKVCVDLSQEVAIRERWKRWQICISKRFL